MFNLIGYGIILILLAMGGVECFRYRSAARGDDEQLPYPRRRLSRRIGVCFLFSAVVLLIMFFPTGVSPWLQLLLLVAVLLAVCIGLLMIRRDLHETSLSVVRESVRLETEASEAFAKIVSDHQAKQPRE